MEIFFGTTIYRWEEWKFFERQWIFWKMFDSMSKSIRLLVRGDRNWSSLNRKGNICSWNLVWGMGCIWWILGVTCSRCLNNVFGLLSLFISARFHFLASPSGILCSHDGKDDYSPLEIPNLFSQEGKATLFPRICTANPQKDPKDCAETTCSALPGRWRVLLDQAASWFC